jgi:hypothetical protein
MAPHLRLEMANVNDRQRNITKPERVWTDPIIRWIRTNRIIGAVYIWFSRGLVPFLFALFVAAPVGLLILPFFVLKFLRNFVRRRKYSVHLPTDRLERIRGTHPQSRSLAAD